MRFTRTFTLGLGLLALAACNEDSPVEVPDGEGITGTWTFEVDVTNAEGACVGEDTLAVGRATVGIVEFQSGDVQADSEWFADSGTHVFTGSRVGDSVSFEGGYTEEGGSLEAVYTLTVNASETLMTGTEAWTWNGTVCPNGLSAVTATRN